MEAVGLVLKNVDMDTGGGERVEDVGLLLPFVLDVVDDLNIDDDDVPIGDAGEVNAHQAGIPRSHLGPGDDAASAIRDSEADDIAPVAEAAGVLTTGGEDVSGFVLGSPGARLEELSHLGQGTGGGILFIVCPHRMVATGTNDSLEGGPGELHNDRRGLGLVSAEASGLTHSDILLDTVKVGGYHNHPTLF